MPTSVEARTQRQPLVRRIASTSWKIFVAGMIVILALWLVNYSEPDDLAKWPLSELRTVLVTVDNESRPLPRERWAEAVAEVAKLQVTGDIGWRGEHWTRLATLEFDWGRRGRYVLSVSTRPSLGDRAIAHFQKSLGHGWWHYRHYRAESLLRWLNEMRLVSPEA